MICCAAGARLGLAPAGLGVSERANVDLWTDCSSLVRLGHLLHVRTAFTESVNNVCKKVFFCFSEKEGNERSGLQYIKITITFILEKLKKDTFLDIQDKKRFSGVKAQFKPLSWLQCLIL